MLAKLPAVLLHKVLQFVGVHLAVLRGCSRVCCALLDPAEARALWHAVVKPADVPGLLRLPRLTPAGAQFLHSVYHFAGEDVRVVLLRMCVDFTCGHRLELLEWALCTGCLLPADLPEVPCAHFPEGYTEWRKRLHASSNAVVTCCWCQIWKDFVVRAGVLFYS